MKISIQASTEKDLEVFFLNQTDETANYMAAFTPKNSSDKTAYLKKWRGLLNQEAVNMQSILLEDRVIGCVVKFIMTREAQLTYAIAKPYWGKGIATEALKQFLTIEATRPIFGRVAFDNYGSQRVLQKAGFRKIGKDHFFANARGKEIEEFIYRLD
ncbi:MAG: GNAT family N-acetyltransferase [Bacteroidota bacterium]